MYQIEIEHCGIKRMNIKNIMNDNNNKDTDLPPTRDARMAIVLNILFKFIICTVSSSIRININ